MAKKLSKRNLEYIEKNYLEKSNRQLAEELKVDKGYIVRAMRDLKLDRDSKTLQKITEKRTQNQNQFLEEETIMPTGPSIDISTGEINKQHILFIILIFLATFFVYTTSFQNEFVWDDEILIENNHFIKDWKYFGKLLTTNSFRGGDRDSNFYRPVQMITYLIDWTIWKDNTFGFHFSNTLFHAMCSLFIYILTFLLTKNTRVSFLTGFIFTIHPLHTEAVTYIAGRADSLGFMFSLLSIICFIIYTRGESKKDIFYLLGSYISFIFALGSKEMTAMTPLMIILYEVSFFKTTKRRSIKQILFRYIPFAIIIFGIYLPFRHYLFEVLDKPVILENVAQKINPVLRAFTFGRTFLFGYYTPYDGIYHLGYLPLLFFPFNLHMERGVPYASSITPQNWQEYFCVLGWLLLIALFIVMIFQFRKNRLLFFCLGWFFLTMFPFTDLIALNANMAEHWLYIPCFSLILIASIYLEKWLHLFSAHFSMDILKKIFVSPLLIIIIFFSVLTMRRNMDWKNDIVIWTATANLSNSSHIHGNLGVAYGRRGDYERAMKEFKHAIRLQMNYPEAHNNLGVLLNAKGDLDEAEKEFRYAIQFNPNYSNAHKNLADVLVKKGNKEEAKMHYARCLEINPFHNEARQKLAKLQ